jgi:hypothetical protein
VKKPIVVKGTLEVPNDALPGPELGLMGVMHVEAHLLDHVGDFRLGEGEVLESPGYVAVGSRVADGAPHVGGDLGLSVDRRGAGLTIAHASVLKDVLSILTLVNEEVV